MDRESRLSLVLESRTDSNTPGAPTPEIQSDPWHAIEPEIVAMSAIVNRFRALSTSTSLNKESDWQIA